MKLELKSVKTFMGTEGYGYNANLYLDGKKCCLIIDSADGGATNYLWNAVEEMDRQQVEEHVRKHVDSLPAERLADDAPDWEKSLYPAGLVKLDLDSFIGRMVDDHVEEQRRARKRKTHVLFRTSASKADEYFSVKHNGNVDQTVQAVLGRHPDATIL